MTIVRKSGEVTPEALALISNARAMLSMMARFGWRELDVAAPDGRIRISASGLVQPADAANHWPETATKEEIVAPHVATVAWLAPVGAELSSGMPIAKLAVLDAVHELRVSRAGIVTDECVAPGDLVEFGKVIARVSVSGPHQS